MTCELQNCSDFSTATARAEAITAMAWQIADERVMAEAQKRAFTQGFIHCFQGRDDLFKTGNADYDNGYCLALFAPPII